MAPPPSISPSSLVRDGEGQRWPDRQPAAWSIRLQQYVPISHATATISLLLCLAPPSPCLPTPSDAAPRPLTQHLRRDSVSSPTQHARQTRAANHLSPPPPHDDRRTEGPNDSERRRRRRRTTNDERRTANDERRRRQRTVKAALTCAGPAAGWAGCAAAE